jgi:ketosteroid isomerase-like protein
MREARGERVLAVVTMRGVGRDSGVPTEMTMAQLWSFEAGRARRMVVFNEVDEGLAAAGLAGTGRARMIRNAVAAFDRSGADEVLPYLTEDVVWEEDPEFPGGQTRHGHDGVRAALGALLDSMAFDSELEEVVDRGDKALALMHWTGHGSASGAEVDMRAAVVFTLRGDRIARVQFFNDRERARAELDAG